jgi:hypothetical protein
MALHKSWQRIGAICAAIVLVGYLVPPSPFIELGAPKKISQISTRSAPIKDAFIAENVRILASPGDLEIKRRILRELPAMGDRGATVIPFLFQIIESETAHHPEDYELWRDVLDALGRFKGEAAMNQLIRKLDSPYAQSRMLAASLLASFGERAYRAVPRLVTQLDWNYNAGLALVKIEPGLPQLAGRLSFLAASPSVDPHVRLASLECLGRLGPKATGVVERLTAMLNPFRTDGGLALPSQLTEGETWQGAVITAIGEMGPAARHTVPRLVPFLTNSSIAMRLFAARALWQITSDPKPLIPILTNILANERLDGPAFHRIFPDEGTNLVWGLQSAYFNYHLRNLSVGSAAAYLLGEFGPSAHAALPFLRRMANGCENYPYIECLFAARAIARVTGDHSDFLSMLLRQIESESALTYVPVMAFLSELGRAAEPAIRRLEALSTNKNPFIASEATNALTRIRRAL